MQAWPEGPLHDILRGPRENSILREFRGQARALLPGVDPQSLERGVIPRTAYYSYLFPSPVSLGWLGSVGGVDVCGGVSL